jgi:outer membrane protein OmpA-like peptidoglycan-associated protein
VFGIISLYGQRERFTLADTTFEQFSLLTTHSIRFYPDTSTIRPESYIFLDSIITFLNKNQRIGLEVHVNDNKYEKRNLSWYRSKEITNYLKQHTVDTRATIYWQDKSEAENTIGRRTASISKDAMPFLDYEVEFTVRTRLNFFTLADTTLGVGDLLCTYEIVFEPGKPVILPESFPFLNSVSVFMFQHPNLVVGIFVYSDTLLEPGQNSKLTIQRADSIKAFFVRKGISKKQFYAHGWGNNYPIYTTNEINSAATKEEQLALHQKNQRVEFEIRSATFKFSDKQFIEGSLSSPAPIYFQLNKDSILPACYPFLDSVADFLRAHPNFVVEVGVHTDSRGNHYGSNLSMRRARSIVEYLENKGVSKLHLVPHGYSDSKPFKTEDGVHLTEKYIMNKKTQEERELLFAMNRRTEFKILKIQ